MHPTLKIREAARRRQLSHSLTLRDPPVGVQVRGSPGGRGALRRRGEHGQAVLLLRLSIVSATAHRGTAEGVVLFLLLLLLLLLFLLLAPHAVQP